MKRLRQDGALFAVVALMLGVAVGALFHLTAGLLEALPWR